MIDGISSPFGEVKKIKKQVDSVKNLEDKIRRNIQRDVKESLPDFAQVFNRKKVSEGGELGDIIEREASKNGLDKELVQSVIEVESGFKQSATSEDGAKGFMQLMPQTANELGVDPEDPAENIKGGTKYLARQLDNFGNLKDALAAYNAGPEAVKEHGGVPPYSETENYVKDVMETFRNLKMK